MHVAKFQDEIRRPFQNELKHNPGRSQWQPRAGIDREMITEHG